MECVTFCPVRTQFVAAFNVCMFVFFHFFIIFLNSVLIVDFNLFVSNALNSFFLVIYLHCPVFIFNTVLFPMGRFLLYQPWQRSANVMFDLNIFFINKTSYRIEQCLTVSVVQFLTDF